MNTITAGYEIFWAVAIMRVMHCRFGLFSFRLSAITCTFDMPDRDPAVVRCYLSMPESDLFSLSLSFALSLYDTGRFHVAMKSQPTHPMLLDSVVVSIVGAVLIGLGQLFVITSFYQLGYTGMSV